MFVEAWIGKPEKVGQVDLISECPISVYLTLLGERTLKPWH